MKDQTDILTPDPPTCSGSEGTACRWEYQPSLLSPKSPWVPCPTIDKDALALGEAAGTHARAARGRDRPAYRDTDTRISNTALSERGCEGRGRLAGGRVGAVQAPLSIVLCSEARPLWR